MQDALPLGETDPLIAWIKDNWTFLAAVAWTGYVDEGRGAVLASGDTTLTDVQYLVASAWDEPGLQTLLAAYNPRREIVLAAIVDGAATFHLLEALPPPPDAVIMSPVERLQRNERHDVVADQPAADRGNDVDPNLLNRPLEAGDLLVGQLCPFCRKDFTVGDLTKWLSLGPLNRNELRKARRGLPFIARSPWPFHYDCGDPKGQGRLATKH